MFDLKVLNSAFDQLEEERGIPREKIIEAVEQALAAAYKKDYGKKGQIVRSTFDIGTGDTSFEQVKIVVDEEIVRMPEESDETSEEFLSGKESDLSDKISQDEISANVDLRPRFNPEHHILLSDARKIKKDAELEEEIVFPLDTKEDYGRIAAQTAKQVIIQKIREAEKVSVLDEYNDKVGEVVAGVIQRIERGNVFVELGRTVAILPTEEQIPGEHYRQGGRIKAYVVDVTEGPRGVNIRLSRSHPQLIEKLFEIETPEIASGVVEIKEIAREAGSRSKIAVSTNDEKVDPSGALIGQRGIRVSTVMNELAGEKIDIVEWSDDPENFVSNALSPAHVHDIEINVENKRAKVTVLPDQLSLAIGKNGQNVRLAVKLTGWGIDIVEGGGVETVATSDLEEESVDMEESSPAPEQNTKEAELPASHPDQKDSVEAVKEKSTDIPDEVLANKPKKEKEEK